MSLRLKFRAKYAIVFLVLILILFSIRSDYSDSYQLTRSNSIQPIEEKQENSENTTPRESSIYVERNNLLQIERLKRLILVVLT
jgi:hypothetical protein